MADFALIRDGIVRNVIVADQEFADAIAADWDAVVDIDALASKPGIDWTYAGGVFTPPVSPPVPVYVRPQRGALGVFFEAYEERGYQWHYIVGPVVFNVGDWTPSSTAQPTVAAAKAYVRANGNDEQFLSALDWAIKYRDRLVESLTAAGVADPSANQRVTKLNTIINVIGGML